MRLAERRRPRLEMIGDAPVPPVCEVVECAELSELVGGHWGLPEWAGPSGPIRVSCRARRPRASARAAGEGNASGQVVLHSEHLSDLLAPSFPDAACRDHIDPFDAAAGRPTA